MSNFGTISRWGKTGLGLSLLILCVQAFQPDWVHAERYQSRLSNLLVKKTEIYLPSRLIVGEEAKFVVRAQAGDQVKVFLSSHDQGFELADGAQLKVGKQPQMLSGTIPENGVLELKMAIPNDPNLLNKVLYVDAVAGSSEDTLAPLSLIDADGRKATTNAMVISKRISTSGPPIMPTMPGVSPQMFNQLTTLGDIYTKKDAHRQELLDNGDIDKTRQRDNNPFSTRGVQSGITK